MHSLFGSALPAAVFHFPAPNCASMGDWNADDTLELLDIVEKHHEELGRTDLETHRSAAGVHVGFIIPQFLR